ncbi:heavy-metal-associated domain-containing protein [Allofournierella sp.]|uniref:heavy-metal-associated domain-containing protein n=1 Tax=Allofournierella sp. TaxID=1940256 RepID=UPI0025D9F8BD|nr:heavy metal-associated domain-containing protein [uncultured Fournierella sp.]
MNPADWIVLAIVAVLLVLAILATKKHFGGKGGCCGCSGGCAGCSGSCSAAPAGHSGQPAASKASKTFPVRGMKCDNCRRAVEQALIAVPGVTMVNVDAKTGRATVTTNGTVTDAQLAGAVTAAGYTAEL